MYIPSYLSLVCSNTKSLALKINLSDFVASICDGRTAAQFEAEGTGTGLWLQNGTDPVADSVRLPATQGEADMSAWTKGACFVTMGR